MSNRIRFGLRTLAGIGALIVLGFAINFAFSQLRNPSIAVSATEATNGALPAKQSPSLGLHQTRTAISRFIPFIPMAQTSLISPTTLLPMLLRPGRRMETG